MYLRSLFAAQFDSSPCTRVRSSTSIPGSLPPPICSSTEDHREETPKDIITVSYSNSTDWKRLERSVHPSLFFFFFRILEGRKDTKREHTHTHVRTNAYIQENAYDEDDAVGNIAASVRILVVLHHVIISERLLFGKR